MRVQATPSGEQTSLRAGLSQAERAGQYWALLKLIQQANEQQAVAAAPPPAAAAALQAAKERADAAAGGRRSSPSPSMNSTAWPSQSQVVLGYS